jgi:hypothetical protein
MSSQSVNHGQEMKYRTPNSNFLVPTNLHAKTVKTNFMINFKKEKTVQS